MLTASPKPTPTRTASAHIATSPKPRSTRVLRVWAIPQSTTPARHDHAITAILPHLKSAAARLLSRATWVRERSLEMLAPPDNDGDCDRDGGDGATSVDDDGGGAASPLRPGLYCLDHDRRVVIPIIEFTVADDANLCTAIRRKHTKYDPWHLRNPSASIARLVPGARDPHTWAFDPLVVIAIGLWSTVPHSAIAALNALGLSVAAVNAALGAVLESIVHDNMLISRLRHSPPTRWCGACPMLNTYLGHPGTTRDEGTYVSGYATPYVLQSDAASAPCGRHSA